MAPPKALRTRAEVKEKLNAITEETIGAAIAVHGALDPGRIESAYEVCWAYEPAERGLAVERQKALPFIYRGVLVDCVRLSYRLACQGAGRC